MLMLGNSNQQQVFVFTNHHVQLHKGASQITKAISITLFTTTSHKINVTDLGIRRCLPTPGHNTCYRHSRAGKIVFKKTG